VAEITIDNVRKSFGALEVLHGVSAKAEDGEFVVLVGPSGCGKSKSTTADDCPRAKTRGQENLRGLDVLTNEGCGLPTPLKVTPDPESGWTFEAEAQFNERGLCEAAHRIKGRLAADPPKLVPGGGIEPP
jgi:hypothetical protein